MPALIENYVYLILELGEVTVQGLRGRQSPLANRLGCPIRKLIQISRLGLDNNNARRYYLVNDKNLCRKRDRKTLSTSKIPLPVSEYSTQGTNEIGDSRRS